MNFTFCTLDLAKAFDTVCHAQLWHSLAVSGVNSLIILLLRLWYGYSYVRLKVQSGVFGNIPVKSGVCQGGVFSLYLFKMCYNHVLTNIKSTCFLDYTNISYVTHADDILLISRTRSGLVHSVDLVSRLFSNIGLTLNVAKYEYLAFNVKLPATVLALPCGSYPTTTMWILSNSMCECY